MGMSLHSLFISVKRLRIEKNTSDDAETFEAVADTGKSNYYIIFHSLIICVSFKWILFVSEFEHTESSLQANDISVSYSSKIWHLRYSKTLKTKISPFSLFFSLQVNVLNTTHLRFLILSGYDHFVSVHKVSVQSWDHLHLPCLFINSHEVTKVDHITVYHS